jgi:hypothetical protein
MESATVTPAVGSDGRSDQPDTRVSLRTGRIVLTAGLLFYFLIAMGLRHFPYQDGPNHLARYVLISKALFGVSRPDVDFRLLPTSYIGLDLVGATLVRFIGPGATLHFVVTLCIALPTLGLYALLRRVAPERSNWALSAVLFAFSWYVLDGLLNYVVGVGLALLWLAWWWPLRRTRAWSTRLAFTVGILLLFTVHLSAPLIVLVVVWIDAAYELRFASARRPWRTVMLAEGVTAVLLAVAVGLLWAWVETRLPAGLAGAQGLEFRTPVMKLLAFAAPFYSFSLVQAGVMIAAYATILIAFVLANLRALRVNSLVVSAFAFFALFLIFPKNVGTAGGVDVRWLLPALLLPFCASSVHEVTKPAASQNRALLIALGACVASGALIGWQAHTRDPLLDDFDRVLSELPVGARLLPIVADRHPHPRIGTYQEYAFWYIIRRDGFVPGLFSYYGSRIGDDPFPHFAHFEIARAYMSPYEWGLSTFTPLDWQRIDCEYNYIIQAGNDERVRAYLAHNATLVARAGAIALFRVGASHESGAQATGLRAQPSVGCRSGAAARLRTGRSASARRKSQTESVASVSIAPRS